jgi:hypothetical protein
MKCLVSQGVSQNICGVGAHVSSCVISVELPDSGILVGSQYAHSPWMTGCFALSALSHFVHRAGVKMCSGSSGRSGAVPMVLLCGNLCEARLFSISTAPLFFYYG